MKFNFNFFLPVLGGVLVLAVAAGVYKYNFSRAAEPEFQASVADTLGGSASEQSVNPNPQPQPVVVPTVEHESPVSVPVSTPSVAAPLPVMPAPAAIVPIIVSPPLVTTAVGAGGMLANRPLAVLVNPPSSAVVEVPVLAPVASSSPATTTSAETPEILADEKFVCVPDQESSSSAAHVFISELFIAMEGADTQEFIKIYNPTAEAVNLASSSLQYLSGSASGISSLAKKNFPIGAGIAAGGYYLIGTGDYSASSTADLLWTQSLSNTGATVLLVGNQIPVTGADNQDIIDRIAYGSGTLLTNGDLPVPLPPVGQSLKRNL